VQQEVKIGACSLKYAADDPASGDSKLKMTYGSNDILSLWRDSDDSSPSDYEGHLHGSTAWTYETLSTTSDRELKKDIVPLWKELMDQVQSSPVARLSSVDEKNVSTGDLHVLSVIERLNPVSFRFKNRVESKYNNYGFIAQEVETLLPNIVHTTGSKDYKALRMTDFISVLTLGLQSSDRLMDVLEQEIERVEKGAEFAATDIENRLLKVEEAFLHNIISKSLENPQIKIAPNTQIIRLLGEETAKWVFDGSENSVFGKVKDNFPTASETGRIAYEPEATIESEENPRLEENSASLAEALQTLIWR